MPPRTVINFGCSVGHIPSRIACVSGEDATAEFRRDDPCWCARPLRVRILVRMLPSSLSIYSTSLLGYHNTMAHAEYWHFTVLFGQDYQKLALSKPGIRDGRLILPSSSCVACTWV